MNNVLQWQNRFKQAVKSWWALGLVAVLGFIALALAPEVLASTDNAVSEVADQSIAEIASQYYGSLTRPVYPEWSGLLPLPLQIVISIALVVLAIILTQVFPRARTLIMLVTIFAVGRHIVWRAVDTLDYTNFWSGVIGTVIFIAEAVSFGALVMGYFQMWKPIIRPTPELPKIPPEQFPSVDIYVCTFNEPVGVLYRSLVGAKSIDYPRKEVYLLDDGNRPEMRELAQRLGVNYIARENNTHAKAGNLNNALQMTKGDLVVVFDADHVACKTFLKETVGFFTDAKVAFVQTPQHFFTPDPVQRNLVTENVVNNEQDLFFHVIQPGNDYWGATFFSGSGAIFRRQALLDIGGFAIETVTEDVHTGLRLHAKGWKSAYYSKDLAAGLSQESYADFIKQRLRWGRGMVQILFNDNPLFCGGLSFGQRICYFSGIWYFFHGFPRIVFMIAPLFFLLFGVMTINAGYFEVMLYYIPSFIALFLGYGALTYRIRDNFWSEVYETAFAVYLFMTNLATIFSPGKSKFAVTPKGTMMDRLNFNWRIVVPQMIIMALTVVGIGMAFVRAIQTPDYLGGIYTNLFWSGYNIVILLASIYLAQERPQYRMAPRVNRQMSCELRLLDGTIAVGQTTDISESGIALVFDEPVPVAGTMALKLLDWEINETSVFYVQAIRSSVDNNNRHYVGCRVVNRTDEQHQQLIRHMFGSDRLWLTDYSQLNTGQTFMSLLMTPFRLTGRKEQAQRRRTPRFALSNPIQCVVEVNGKHLNGYATDISESGLSATVQQDNALQLDAVVNLHVQWAEGNIGTMQARIVRIESARRGQSNLGLNFESINKEQRLDLIRQIYGGRDSLVRVAPASSRLLNGLITRQNGQQVRCVTQEISEMGARVQLEQAVGFAGDEQVQLTLQWEDGSQDNIVGNIYVGQGNPGADSSIVLVYFKGIDMKTIDRLNQKLHAPVENQAFYSPVQVS